MNRRSALLFSVALIFAATPNAEAALTFRWLGNSGFTITDGKTTLLFDPAVTATPLSAWVLPLQKVRSDEKEVRYWAERCGISDVDATFVNHTHTDHAIDAPTAVRLFGGKLLGSASLRQIGLGQGVPESSMRVLKDREEVKFGDFTVQAFITPHAPHFANILLADGDITHPVPAEASPWEYRVGQTFSYWITHPQGRILFQAPGRVIDPDVLAPLKPDTVLLTIANRPSSESLVRKRVLASGAAKVIPLHWDNFFLPHVRNGAPAALWGQKPDEFDQKFRALAPGVELEWPGYCRPIEVGRSRPKP